MFQTSHKNYNPHQFIQTHLINSFLSLSFVTSFMTLALLLEICKFLHNLMVRSKSLLETHILE